MCNILQCPPPYKALVLDQARRRDAATGETGMKPLGGWQLLGPRYHANYPDHKTCAAAITVVLRDILALVPGLIPLISQLP